MTEPRYDIAHLLHLMTRLREPVYGCPWDLAQSYKSITSSTLEEAYEVVDAIEKGNFSHLKEELGDLLFQVVFYSQLGSEDSLFDFDDVVSSVTTKLLRRHPHVFPDGTLSSRGNPDAQRDPLADSVGIKSSWEKMKAEERSVKGHYSVLDDVPVAFPAVTRAAKLQKRASSVGFDWKDSHGVYDKLEEELGELKEAQALKSQADIEDELGDVLFTVINLARHLKVDPETALRKSNNKFEQRFRTMEALANEDRVDFSSESPASLNQRWNHAKRVLDES